MVADRNLLFGMLALHAGLVSREQLLDAMCLWTSRKGTPLGVILRERGALDDADVRQIDGLVDRQVHRHGDAHKSLASVRIDPTVQRELLQVNDADLRFSLDSLTPIDTPWPQTEAPSGEKPAVAHLRYRRLRHHAKGGLGTVSVAVDEELRREVALKEIQDPYADNVDSRSRFVREAWVTGNLEHPGIVPVYGLLTGPDGRPSYAMRFIHGESLHAAVARFHAADKLPGRDGRERSLALRGLLTRFVAVCNAVAFAHSRGVIHRDLKPANVMLGDFGETLVVDWGLARILDQDEEQKTPTGLVRLHDQDTPATQLGQALGTPAFMPPEQARGEHHLVGKPADVFALGATLYVILTGKAPYSGPELLALARRGNFVPPRQVVPTVPRSLEAVCLKAMRPLPHDRYASASELAEEVEHWLADEPVKAYREPAIERARRWGRRHRTLTTSAVVLLLAGLVAVSVGLWAVRREQARTAAALAEANDNFAQARQAVDECFGLAKNAPALQGEGLRAVRQLLLRKTLPFYQSFTAKKPEEDALVERQAEYLFRVAFITNEIDDKTEAVAKYEQARDLLEHLVRAHPEETRHKVNLARTWTHLGIVQRDVGQVQEALRSHERALELRQQLSDAHPEAVAHQANLAQSYSALGVLEHRLGRHQQSRQHLEQAKAAQEKLSQASPREAEHKEQLAHTCTELARLQRDQGQLMQARSHFEQAATLRTQLLQAQPNRTEYQNDLAESWTELARLHRETGQPREAVKYYQQARDVQLRLARAYPDVQVYQSNLAQTWGNLGILCQDLGQLPQAQQCYSLAADLYQQLRKANPKVTSYQDALAGTWINQGSVQAATGKVSEARASYERARDVLVPLTKAHPELAAYRANLAVLWNNLGNLHRDANQAAEARTCFEQARALHEKLVKENPTVPQYLAHLAAEWNNLGLLDEKAGRLSEALAAYEKARYAQMQLTKSHPQVTEYQALLAITWNNLGNLQRKLAQPAEAEASYHRAREIRLKLHKAYPGSVEYQLAVVTTCTSLANVQGTSGKVPEALETITPVFPLLAALCEREPANAGYRLRLRNAHWLRAQMMVALQRPAEAVGDWNEVVRLSSGDPRIEFAGRAWRCDALLRAGEYRRAADAVLQLVGGLHRLTNK